MTDHMTHLLDGDPVFVPYMSVGHHDRDDPAASPVVETVLAVEGVPSHPYSGKPACLVRLVDGRLIVVAVERLAHAETCSAAECWEVWGYLDVQLDDVLSGAMLAAGMRVQTPMGEAMLLVDAEDLDLEEEENEEAAE